MKAWIGTGRGADVSYALHEIATPAPGPDELLVSLPMVW